MQPDLPPPYPFRCSPDLAAARARSAEWALVVGVLGSGDPWAEVWDERDVADFDIGLFASLVHPDATGERLVLIACWYTWAWYLDDLIVERFKRTRDLVGARRFLERLRDMCGPGRRVPENPAERGLADLWDRAGVTGGRWAVRVPNLFDDALWEIGNVVAGRVPEQVDYLTVRRQSGGAVWAARFNEYALGVEFPVDVLETSTTRRLLDAFADVVDLHNDIVSYRRETEYENDVNNRVLVAQRFLRSGVVEATLHTMRVVEDRLGLFEHMASAELPALLADRRTDPSTAAAVLRHVQGLRDWLGGDYQWHLETNRYREASWRRKARPETRGLCGLGTAAARLASNRPWPPAIRR